MNEFIMSFFEKRANSILSLCLERANDRNHFKQVQHRISQGEDLSKELPQLKKLDRKAALDITKTLIKRCEDDMCGYWLLPHSSKIKVEVEHTYSSKELVPRFTVSHTITTPVGKVVIRVVTQGRHITLQLNTRDVAKSKLDEAIRSLERNITLLEII